MPRSRPATGEGLEVLRAHIGRRVRLTDREFTTCAALLTPRTVRRRQFLLQENEVCGFLGFVTSGCLRQYTVDRKGDEHILQFAVRDWWISDLESFLSQT